MTRPFTRLATALTAVAALATSFAAPAHAEEEPPDGTLPPITCPTFSGDPSAANEFEAYRLALACGFNIEVLSLADIDRRVFATPNETLESEITAEPYRVRDALGAWTDIDPTLVPQADGSTASAATVIGVKTGAGGGAPFVTATDPDGGVLSLRWPLGALPAPTLSGSVATYPEVLPGVDLAVQAEPVGFSWVLVVKTPEAAADPALARIDVGVETIGLTIADDPESGGLDVRDADGDVVFEAGQAIMWDSSNAGEPTGFAATAEDPAADPGRIGDVDVQPTDTGITLVPDTAMLADPAVTYPLYIDPPFTSSRKAWANVLQSRASTGWTGDGSWPRSGGMRVGLDTWSTCGSGCGLWRSVVTLNVGGLKGKYVASASVNVLQTHMGGCADEGLQLWRTGEISNGVSWNKVNWWYGDPLQSKTVPSSNKTGCSGKDNEWVEFGNGEVKEVVQSAADQKHSTISFGLRSSDEGTRNAWRRLKTDSIKLHVTYYVYPPTPDRLTVGGVGCDPTESGSPWVGESTPKFSARARSSEDESVYLRYRVRKVASEVNYHWYRTPDPVGPFATVTNRITKALPDGSYKWQARSDSRQSEAVNSGYTGYCYFKVDATNPTDPVISGPPGAITAGTNVKINLSSSDPVVNGTSSGIDRFEYTWATSTGGRKSITSTGSAQITLPAVPAGRHLLKVEAIDKAGNKSVERAFTFFAGSAIPATVMGAWRLGGDLIDDTAHGGNLVVGTGTGAGYGPDASGRSGAALNLYGSTCLHSPKTDKPIHTDRAFTVALSVRLNSATGISKVLTQGGDLHSAYQIQHNATNNTWSFSLLSTPGADAAWKSVTAASPVALGQWLHIAGTYDPDADLQRLYFNGVLAAEQAVTFEPWDAQKTFSLGCLRTPSGSHGHFFHGAVDNVVVWQGLATSSQIKSAASEPPVVGAIAHWELRGNGDDASAHKRALTLPASATQGFDPFGRPDGALVLDGQSCATTGVPIVPGDEPFGIGAWVNVERLTGSRQVLFAQTDAQGRGFVAGITADGKWELGPATGSATATGITPMSVGHYTPPKVGWQYVQFTYEGEGSWRINVNGNNGENWNSGVHVRAYAPLSIGCGLGGYFKGMIHDVRVWRGSSSFSTVGDKPAEVGSWWNLEGSGADASVNGRDLAFTGGYGPARGWSNNRDGAIAFDGTGSAATSSPAFATDESFSVAAWVRLDSLETNQVVVSAAGAQNTGFRLAYHKDRKTFEFTMTSQDAPSGSGGVFHVAHGGPVAEIGTWYFVVGTFDLRTKVMKLYVDGVEAGRTNGPVSPWEATGPLVIGAAASTASRWNNLVGRVDDVAIWSGVVSGRSVRDMFNPNETAAS